jgi:hypothetical protein
VSSSEGEKMIFGLMECRIECTKCGAPVPLNGPLEVAHCEQCQTDIDIPHEYWNDIFKDFWEDLKDLKEKEGRNVTQFGTFKSTLMWGRRIPRCTDCKEDLVLPGDLSQAGTATCPKCKKVVKVLLPPEWLKQGFGKAKVLVGAILQEKPVETGSKATKGDLIVFTCPKCGGALEVDGSERMLPCKYCGVKVYLPDDLWLRLHPAKKMEDWFVGFE